MKRIVVCVDGTWQKLRTERPTSVGIIAQSVASRGADGVEQVVIYSKGVGSGYDAAPHSSRMGALAGTLANISGGAFGEGLQSGIIDLYLSLAFLFEPDDELFLFGFSRGAYSVRSLAGLLRKCGILQRAHASRAEEAYWL